MLRGSLCLRRTSYLTTSIYSPSTPRFCLCVPLEVSVLRDCETSAFFGRQTAVGGALASAAVHKRACSAALKNVRNFRPTTNTLPNLCFLARSLSRWCRLQAERQDCDVTVGQTYNLRPTRSWCWPANRLYIWLHRAESSNTLYTPSAAATSMHWQTTDINCDVLAYSL